MPELHLTLLVNGFVVVALAAIAALIAFFAYRVTVPPLSPLRRWILIALRSFGTAFIVFFIAAPALTIVHRSSQSPAVLLLVDNSRSMTVKDRSGSRREALLRMLESDAFRSLQSRTRLRFARFDRIVKPLEDLRPDSLSLNGSRTDIAGALQYAAREIERENVRAVVLVSDGIVTEGANPAYAAEDLGIPVFTVAVGDSAEQKDLVVRNVLTNDRTWVGNKTPVQVTIHSAGYSGERVEVVLTGPEGDEDRTSLALEPGSRDYRVTLALKAAHEGRRKYSVRVSALPGELTTANNRSAFFIDVLKSAMNVTLIAGIESPDVAFVRRAFEEDKNVSVRAFIGRNDGSFSGGDMGSSVLSTSQCIVLVNFPAPWTPLPVVERIRQAAETGTPILFLSGPQVDPSRFALLEPVLPVTLRAPDRNEVLVFASVDGRQKEHAVMQIDAPPEGWSALPPVFRWQAGFHLKPEAEALATVRFQNAVLTDPFIAIRSVNNRKSLAVTAYGLWRWDLMTDVPESATPVLGRFLGNSLRWLTTRDDERRVQVRPTREQITDGEPVEFNGQAYDAANQPVDDADVNLTVRSGSGSNELTLSPLGNGQYAGTLDPLPEGDYTFTAVARRGALNLGESRGSFVVGGVNAEFLDTRTSISTLDQIARRSGGRLYTPDDLNRLPDDIVHRPTFASREQVRTIQEDLWNSSWAMGLAILLFAVEWLLRKLWGLL